MSDGGEAVYDKISCLAWTHAFGCCLLCISVGRLFACAVFLALISAWEGSKRCVRSDEQTLPAISITLAPYPALLYLVASRSHMPHHEKEVNSWKGYQLGVNNQKWQGCSLAGHTILCVSGSPTWNNTQWQPSMLRQKKHSMLQKMIMIVRWDYQCWRNKCGSPDVLAKLVFQSVSSFTSCFLLL